MKNDYASLIAPWKMDLALRRARKRRIRGEDLEDAQQALAQAILGFEFDEEKAGGASEATAITALVDHQLSFIQRGQCRRRAHLVRHRESLGGREGIPLPEPVDYTQEVAMGRGLDLREALARLTTLERDICTRLSGGISRLDIAVSLGLSRYALERIIDGLREKFEAWHLNSWLGGP